MCHHGEYLHVRTIPIKTPAGHSAIAKCWLIVEQIRSAGNLGTILRTAEACGVGGVVFLGPWCDPFDPVTVRGSMGAVFQLTLVRSNAERFVRWANDQGLAIVGLSPDAEHLWTQLPATRPLGIVIGEERQGLSDRLRKLCHTTVRLPMQGRADSLNVGVAAGVMMYELVRLAERQVYDP